MAEDYFDNQPIYDLRQVYAKDLLGDTLKKVKYFRENKMYSEWLDFLRWHLFADLYQKLNQTEIKSINDKIEDVKTIVVKYPNAYLGKKKDPRENETVMKAIWELEVLMKNIAEQHAIYGRTDDDEGL